ncbi:hypothetical protein LEP1GSC150_1443 [Leptospira interrogans serovar Copenhageni str. LT2050]|uniref:Alpha/beta hydrolase domain protein n=2 Tax=Leptospira interrogans TaxID=173 RepID=M3H4I8_LEPIT|nr:hypothetical protein LEP1GSC150_1443 [Leptospira interrogans serovar Copenhageni str. LT2050]
MFFFCLGLFSYCNNSSWDKLKPSKNKNTAEELLKTLTVLFWGEFNHELYKFIPIPFVTLKSQLSADQFAVATSESKENKPKIVLIHGWDFQEKTLIPPRINSQR